MGLWVQGLTVLRVIATVIYSINRDIIDGLDSIFHN
jgi:hypothetical protein